jgi:hypothetical protein
VDVATASKAKCYPEGCVDIAKKDHAERLARIMAAQSDPANRGMKDLGTQSGRSSGEKDLSQNADFNPDGTKRVKE